MRDKHLCIVVKMSEVDAFVLTAYLTDSVKRIPAADAARRLAPRRRVRT